MKIVYSTINYIVEERDKRMNSNVFQLLNMSKKKHT